MQGYDSYFIERRSHAQSTYLFVLLSDAGCMVGRLQLGVLFLTVLIGKYAKESTDMILILGLTK